IAGLGVVAALAAPWFIYMYMHHGRDFVDGYLLDENIRLFASRRFGNQPGRWFYARILAVGLLPWTPLLVGRLVDDLAAALRGERPDDAEVLLWAWTLAVIGFFTVSTFRLDHYIFPAAPALSLLCARSWSAIGAEAATRTRATRIGALLIGPLLVA